MARSKTKSFTIPKEFLLRFFQELEDSDLTYQLTEVDENESLCLDVEYSPEERDSVMNLVELEDEFYNNDEENEEG